MLLASTTVTKFPFWKELWNRSAYGKSNAQGYGTFLIMENPMLGSPALAVPPQCKGKMILSAAH
jgi:hypothetical protein